MLGRHLDLHVDLGQSFRSRQLLQRREGSCEVWGLGFRVQGLLVGNEKGGHR